MRKRLCVCAVVVMACVLCLSCVAGFGAMQNLLMDFREAIMRRDSSVPVVPWSGGLLEFDGLKPWIFSRRLVKVSVNANIFWQVMSISILEYYLSCINYTHTHKLCLGKNVKV